MCAKDGVDGRTDEEALSDLNRRFDVSASTEASNQHTTCTSLCEYIVMEERCIDIDLELSLVSSRVPSASAGSMDENVVVGGCSLTPVRHARLGALQHRGC